MKVFELPRDIGQLSRGVQTSRASLWDSDPWGQRALSGNPRRKQRSSRALDSLLWLGSEPGSVTAHISSACNTVLMCLLGPALPPTFSSSVLVDLFAPLAPGGPSSLVSTTAFSGFSVMSQWVRMFLEITVEWRKKGSRIMLPPLVRDPREDRASLPLLDYPENRVPSCPCLSPPWGW